MFKVNKKIEQTQWEVHYDKERKHRDVVQASIERCRVAGEIVASVHEDSITTWGQWQAKDSHGKLISWSDYEEAGEEVTSSYRRPRPRQH